jgi:hypothetical protein
VKGPKRTHTIRYGREVWAAWGGRDPKSGQRVVSGKFRVEVTKAFNDPRPRFHFDCDDSPKIKKRTSEQILPKDAYTKEEARDFFNAQQRGKEGTDADTRTS